MDKEPAQSSLQVFVTLVRANNGEKSFVLSEQNLNPGSCKVTLSRIEKNNSLLATAAAFTTFCEQPENFKLPPPCCR